MYRVTNFSKLEAYGFIHYNVGRGKIAEYWMLPTNVDEYIMAGVDTSQGYIRVEWDGTVKIVYEWEQRVQNGDGDDYGGEVVFPLDKLWELIKAGVVKKGREKNEINKSI